MTGNRWAKVKFEDRLLANIDTEGPMFETGSRCWLWLGTANKRGYGAISRDGQRIMAHHGTYELYVGPIPEGLELDHLCRNPRCVNPLHLEPVTHAENVARGTKAQQTHCKRGHEFTPANTYICKRGLRVCRACHRAREYAIRHGLDFEAYVHGSIDSRGGRMRALVDG